MIDRKKLAVIHIVKKELGLGDTAYRDILWKVASVKSAVELDDEKFRKLMNYFVRSKYYQVNPFGMTIRQKLYIQYLAREIGWEKEHLDNFIRKYYHKASPDKLSKSEAIKVIESLKAVKEHKR